MNIHELITGPLASDQLGGAEANALTEPGALQEAQLVEAQLDVSTGRLGLVFDLRQALQLRAANTGILVFYGVQQFGWSGSFRETARTAWTVVNSVPDNGYGSANLALYLVPDGEVNIVARGGTFYVGDVLGLPEAPPDFTECSYDAIRAGMQSLQSAVVLRYAMRTELADGAKLR